MTSCSKVASVASKITLSRLPSVGEFTVERDGVDAGRRGGRRGRPRRAAARADRDAPLRRHGLARARARRAPRGRATTRAGHGRSSPAPTPDDYGYETLAADLLARARRPRDRARGARRRLDGRAHDRRGSRSTTATASPGSCSITPAYTPEGEHDRPRALGRARARAADRRGRGLRRAPTATRTCPSAGATRSIKVLHQRLAAHEHPEAVADALNVRAALARVRGLGRARRARRCRRVVVASRDEADPGHPYAVGERYARGDPRRGAASRRSRARRRSPGRAASSRR